MTHTNQMHSHGRTRSHRRALSPVRRPHASSFSDAVMAAYIHELSVRSRPGRTRRSA